MKLYSLKKCKKILISSYHLWRKKKKSLPSAVAIQVQGDLKRLQQDILHKNRGEASFLAEKCQEYSNGILKKSSFEQGRDFFFALVFALVVALLIRQVWFELYEIPTGSMRPTLKEKDRLMVSKTDFGINLPFSTGHLYFDPNLAKRAGIIVFTAENLPIHDPDTLYFWVIPAKKQLVKRLMGRPGDILYFYGGKIYGIDKEGRDISNQLQLPQLGKIDHIPFLAFEGKVIPSEPFRSPIGNGYRMAIIHQINEPIARLTFLGNNRLEGEMLHAPRIHDRNSPPVKQYHELWGIGNYALARIVRKEDVKHLAEKHGISLDEEKLYLELKHHPDLKQLEFGKDLHGTLRPQFILNTSIIPLDESHLKEIFNHLYTSRFVVKNGFAFQYRLGESYKYGTRQEIAVHLDGIPDGTYEYYYGQAYVIKWGGIAVKLKSTHPLMRYSADLAEKFFNFGVDFDKRYAQGSHFNTERFAYFREGELFLMGNPIFKKGEDVLSRFIDKEKQRESESNIQNRYDPFIDNGPPLLETGELDIEKIKRYGLLIPPEMYLGLGDNFSVSADSRDFGFIPQTNLRGGPSFIFWPPAERFGPPNQPSYPWLTIPNVIVWILGLTCIGIWWIFYRRHHYLPLKDL